MANRFLTRFLRLHFYPVKDLRRLAWRDFPLPENNRNGLKNPCKWEEQEDNRETRPHWSWARNHIRFQMKGTHAFIKRITNGRKWSQTCWFADDSANTDTMTWTKPLREQWCLQGESSMAINLSLSENSSSWVSPLAELLLSSRLYRFGARWIDQKDNIMHWLL